MTHLTITQGPGAGRTVDPTKAGVVIGRQPGLDFTLDSVAVSRRHARLTLEDAQVWVEDLGSSNGTFVNETRITGRTPLGPRDTLRIGASLFRLDGPSHFDPEMTIHRQTAAATSNAELFRDHTGTKLKTLLQVAHQLRDSLDTDTLLNRLLEQLLNLFPHADRALVLKLEGNEPVVRTLREQPGKPGTRPWFSQSVLRTVFSQAVAVLAADTHQEQNLKANLTLAALGIRSLLCVPLESRDGKVLSALQLDRFQSGQAFSADDLYLLTAVALMVSPVLENTRLHQDLLVKERMQRDLAMAREIQKGYLPTQTVELADGPVELHAELHPAMEMSGDFYDYFPLDDHRLAVVVADVSGKGTPAALFMTSVHTLVRHLAQIATGPADLLARVNDALAQDNPNLLFVTMVFGIYNAANGRVTLAHGGHPPSLVRRRDGTVEELPQRGAPLLGIQRDISRSEEAEIQLSPGDAILLYTDGVTESPGQLHRNELFGTHRLMEAWRTVETDGGLPEWTTVIRQAVAQFSGPTSMADDITLLVLRHSPNGPGSSIQRSGILTPPRPRAFG